MIERGCLCAAKSFVSQRPPEIIVVQMTESSVLRRKTCCESSYFTHVRSAKLSQIPLPRKKKKKKKEDDKKILHVIAADNLTDDFPKQWLTLGPLRWWSQGIKKKTKQNKNKKQKSSDFQAALYLLSCFVYCWVPLVVVVVAPLAQGRPRRWSGLLVYVTSHHKSWGRKVHQWFLPINGQSFHLKLFAATDKEQLLWLVTCIRHAWPDIARKNTKGRTFRVTYSQPRWRKVHNCDGFLQHCGRPGRRRTRRRIVSCTWRRHFGNSSSTSSSWWSSVSVRSYVYEWSWARKLAGGWFDGGEGKVANIQCQDKQKMLRRKTSRAGILLSDSSFSEGLDACGASCRDWGTPVCKGVPTGCRCLAWGGGDWNVENSVLHSDR